MSIFSSYPHWGYLVIGALTCYFAFTGIVKKSQYYKTGTIKGKPAQIYGYFFAFLTLLAILLTFS